MSTTSEELKKLYKKLGGDEENIRKASTPAEILNGINELDIGSAIMSDAKIEDLKDVEIVSPVKGETIEFDGEKWVNVDKPDMSVVKSVSGNPVEFNDGASAPLVKCVSAITGSQDLHGYDKPWVGGAGKNILPFFSGTKTGGGLTSVSNDDGTYNVTGTGTGSAVVSYFLTDYTFSGQYTYYTNSPIATIYIRDKSTQTISALNNGQTVNTEDYDIVQLALYASSGTVVNIPRLECSLVPYGESYSTFAPYSNICPITAYTEGKIEVRGKNIWDEQWAVGSLDASGEPIVNANSIRSKNYTPCQGNVDYYLNFSLSEDEIRICFYDENKTFISRTGWLYKGSFQTPANARYMKLLTSTVYGSTYRNDIIIAIGSQAVDYEPYTSTTHTTTYPSAIFRGSEDVVNGEVTSEKVKIQSDGTGFLIANNGILYNDSNILTGVSSVVADLMQIITDKYAFFNIIGGTVDLVGQEGKFGLQIIGNVIRIAICDSRFTTAEDFRTYLANNPLEIAYELATPTTSSVTPTNLPVKSLYGYNHIESSTGDLDIDYINGAYDPLIQVMSKQVVANPTDAASETLTGLKVGDTTYSVPQGGGGSIQRMLMNNTITIE